MNAIQNSLKRIARFAKRYAAEYLPLVILYVAVVIRHSAFEEVAQGPEGLRRLALELAQAAAVIETVRRKTRHTKACERHRPTKKSRGVTASKRKARSRSR